MDARATRIAIALVLAAGCGRGSDVAPTAVVAWPVRATPCAAPVATRAAWQHRTSALVVAAGEPRHVAADAVVAAGAPAVLHGKFAYGGISKDLEDEPVQVFVASDGCAARPQGAARTDDDGVATTTLTGLAVGFHRFWLLVGGDNSFADGGVWVLPGPTPAVVFDVDGTLTVDDGELFEDLLGGSALAFDGAAAVVQAWADKGYLIIYVTGRPYPLRARTRRWLDAGGFPYGPLFTPDRLRDGLPTRDGVGAYKRDTLVALQAAGVAIVRAYGNAATDVCAYAEARLDPARTFIVSVDGARPGCDGRPAPRALTGYVDHLAEVAAQPAAARPATIQPGM